MELAFFGVQTELLCYGCARSVLYNSDGAKVSNKRCEQLLLPLLRQEYACTNTSYNLVVQGLIFCELGGVALTFGISLEI